MDYFYRVEIPAIPLIFGIGPYFGCDVEQKCIEGEIDLPNYKKLVNLSNRLALEHNFDGENPRPSLRRDFPTNCYENITIENYYCGFTNVYDLEQWFEGFVGELKSLGYKMVKYEVESLIVGYSQQQVFACQDDIISREIFELP